MRFGYYVTNRGASVLRGVITLVLGVALLVWPGFTAGLIVKLIAAFLLAAGTITLIFALNAASKTQNPIPFMIGLNVAVYLILGLLVFLFPNFFLNLIAFLFGAVLFIAGISQIINLYMGSKYGYISGGMYVIPIIISICGIALFFTPKASTEALTMIFGGAIALYGASELAAVWRLRKGNDSNNITNINI